MPRRLFTTGRVSIAGEAGIRPIRTAAGTCCDPSTERTAACGHLGRGPPGGVGERTDRGGAPRAVAGA